VSDNEGQEKRRPVQNQQSVAIITPHSNYEAPVGQPVEMNTVLKLSTDQGLPDAPALDTPYSFKKSGARFYPIGVPVELIGDDWQTIGKAVIDEFTVNLKATSGRYRVVKRFTPAEAEAFNRVWRADWVD